MCGVRSLDGELGRVPRSTAQAATEFRDLSHAFSATLSSLNPETPVARKAVADGAPSEPKVGTPGLLLQIRSFYIVQQAAFCQQVFADSSSLIRAVWTKVWAGMRLRLGKRTVSSSIVVSAQEASVRKVL